MERRVTVTGRVPWHNRLDDRHRAGGEGAGYLDTGEGGLRFIANLTEARASVQVRYWQADVGSEDKSWRLAILGQPEATLEIQTSNDLEAWEKVQI